jgi:hypothetical protein
MQMMLQFTKFSFLFLEKEKLSDIFYKNLFWLMQ